MKVFILINSIVFLLYGLGFMFFPEPFSLFVTDTIPMTESGLIDMRATYGGMSIGFAIFLDFVRRDTNMFSIGIRAILLIIGGMALGRSVGMILDGSPNRLMYIYLLLEIIVVIIGLRLLSKSTKN